MTKNLTLMKVCFIVFISLVGLLSLSGCGNNESSSVSKGDKDTIKIGASLPLSGTIGYMGKEVDQGIKAVIEMTNDNGGINGQLIEYAGVDDSYDPSVHLSNTRFLVEQENVVALVGSLGTESLLAAAKYLNPKNIPVIGALSIADSVNNPAQNSLFALPSPQSTGGPALVEYAVKDLGAKRIAMVYQNDSWGKPAYEFAKKKLNSLGQEFVAVVNFEPDAGNMSTQFHQIQKADPDAVILYAMGSQAAQFVNEVGNSGLDWDILGADGINSPDWVELVGENGEGVISLSNYHTLDSPEMEWVKGLHEKYGYPTPTPNSLMGTSAALVFVEAAKMIKGEITSEALLEAMENIKNFDQNNIGPEISFGKLEEGPDSRRGQTDLVIVQVQNGRFETITK
ncbi:ABC transporter substrate-binding protein [Bacillus sp. JJ1533]|uniref:ABC transporter substrate-binding protein n=1 Tax=Bacillus sp. JJ1533 TaxID=3122959 RepID=UPI002FFEFDDB